MNAWRWNGHLYESCTSLPLTDRGFRYGMSLFETVRLWQGRPLFLEPHLNCLRAACAQRGFPCRAEALAAVEPLLEKQADGVARIYVTAGDGTLLTPDVTEPRIFILCEPRPAPAVEPCRLIILPDLYHATFGGLKTANYWPNADALQRALRSECDEALLFNENAELVSAATGNVFVVRDGEVSTPSLSCGARDGVTRAWVREQLPVREESLFLEDLQHADEIFLTSSWHGVRLVAHLEGRSLPRPVVSTRLTAAFQAAVAR